MAKVDLEQFRVAHQPPGCEVIEKSVAVNSGKVDPSMGDYEPVFLEVPYCKTHDVEVDTREFLKKLQDN